MIPQALKPALAYEAQNSPVDGRYKDQFVNGKRDNIHNSMLQYRKKALEFARAIIVGLWPKKRRGFDEMAFPTSLFDGANGWSSAAGDPLKISLSENGRVFFSGDFAVGTRSASGVVVARLPENVTSLGPREFKVSGDVRPLLLEVPGHQSVEIA
ncbi:hypothetical protein [Ensifer sp. R-19]|uniref:hypothetical protein n=1 Tax=Ensifer sp. R-19 TaxID=3404055 RepID=UPI003CEA4A32